MQLHVHNMYGDRDRGLSVQQSHAKTCKVMESHAKSWNEWRGEKWRDHHHAYYCFSFWQMWPKLILKLSYVCRRKWEKQQHSRQTWWCKVHASHDTNNTTNNNMLTQYLFFKNNMQTLMMKWSQTSMITSGFIRVQDALVVKSFSRQMPFMLLSRLVSPELTVGLVETKISDKERQGFQSKG